MSPEFWLGFFYAMVGTCSVIGAWIAEGGASRQAATVFLFGICWPFTLLSFLFAKVYR